MEEEYLAGINKDHKLYDPITTLHNYEFGYHVFEPLQYINIYVEDRGPEEYKNVLVLIKNKPGARFTDKKYTLLCEYRSDDLGDGVEPWEAFDTINEAKKYIKALNRNIQQVA